MSIILSSQYTQRFYTWANWKTTLSIKSFIYQYDDDGYVYTIWGYDGPDVHICKIWKGTVPIDTIKQGYSQIQNDLDKSNFEINFKPSGNLSIEKRTTDGRIRYASEKPNSSRVSFYSVDWTDRTTWYHSSIKNTETIISNDIDGYYHLAHNNIIDTYHAKITQEDFLKDTNGYSYRISVIVNGQTKIEQDPHYGYGGDFIVDYINGIIIPLTIWGSNSAIITYHYSTTANFVIKPSVGYSLSIDMAECQFSTDLILNDTVTFQVQGYAGAFAPQLGLPYNTLIPLTYFKYKSMNDYLNDSVRAYPVYPAISSSTWRGIPVQSTVLDWDYVASTTLLSSKGMQIVICLDHNLPFGGNFATATFYCTTQPEI